MNIEFKMRRKLAKTTSNHTNRADFMFLRKQYEDLLFNDCLICDLASYYIDVNSIYIRFFSPCHENLLVIPSMLLMTLYI